MIVYHSTQANFARAILQGGFALDRSEYGFGSAKGRGVYCTPSLAGAAPWYDMGFGQMVTLMCRLRPGLRIAWIEKEYDRQLVVRLQREFGRQVTHSPHTFHKALPKNKQLTKDELLALVGYFFHERNRACGFERTKRYHGHCQRWWRDNFAYLRRELARHDFGAIGDRSERAWDTDEITVFNPADITAISAHLLDTSTCDLFEAPWRSGDPLLLPALSADALAGLAAAEDERQKRLADE